jgi:hypothetical protein
VKLLTAAFGLAVTVAAEASSPAHPLWIDASNWMKCDGVTDDTAGFQTGVNTATQRTLFLPAGDCLISDSVTVTSTTHIVGAGGGADDSNAGTTLEWRGPVNTPMLDLQGVRDAVFEDFLIEASASHPLTIGIRSQTVSGKLATGNKFYRIYMNGITTGLGKGFAFVAASGGDSNNDMNTFEEVEVNNFTVAGWSFEHSQSKGHRLVNCTFLGIGDGGPLRPNSYGVTTALGSNGNGGSFMWYGGGGGYVGNADFYLGNPNDAILISGGNFEGSPRLLETTGPSWNAFPVTIQGIRWAGNGLASDGEAVRYKQQGPLNLIGNILGTSPDSPLQIYVTGSGAPIVAIAIGNTLVSALANPFTGTGAWILLGNNRNFGPASMIGNKIP